MRWLRVLRGEQLVARAALADRFWLRLRGLMFRRSLPDDQGVIFPNCSSVHTFGMLMAIDIVFLRGETVGRIVPAAAPNRIYRDDGSSSVLELAAGRAGRMGLQPGERLTLSESTRESAPPTDRPSP